jgi:hypothetical protein
MRSKFAPVETVLFTFNVVLGSRTGHKIIANSLTYNKNIAVILHVLSADGLKEQPKLLADIFSQFK